MDIDIIGRNLGITDRFREYAEEKADKVTHLADRALSLEIKASRHHASDGGSDRVELSLIGPGPLVRAEATGVDKYAAFDLALTRLLERVRRAKDRKKIHRGGHRRPTSLQEATTGGLSVVDITPASADALGDQHATEDDQTPQPGDEDYCPVVIREKVFASEPMTVDDALYRMELVGHDFYLFVDRETERPSVVYRRKGWDYGVIGLERAGAGVPEEALVAERIR